MDRTNFRNVKLLLLITFVDIRGFCSSPILRYRSLFFVPLWSILIYAGSRLVTVWFKLPRISSLCFIIAHYNVHLPLVSFVVLYFYITSFRIIHDIFFIYLRIYILSVYYIYTCGIKVWCQSPVSGKSNFFVLYPSLSLSLSPLFRPPPPRRPLPADDRKPQRMRPGRLVRGPKPSVRSEAQNCYWKRN